MIIKFHGGRRTGAGAADYLMDFRDHRGRERPGVKVLRGNPGFVGNVIDSLPFEHRFTSAVIAWAPDDQPTPDQINRVLDSFEQHAWAGLEPDRYAWTAVRHDGHAGDGEDAEEGKGVHVHILAARVDLETGKSLNIAPPGWQKYFVNWCNVINSKYDWARPDDPARRVPVRLGHGAGPGAQQKLRITEDLLARIQGGDINNRQDVVNALRTYGEIARTEKNYVSITPHGGGRNLRLRGAIYEADFDGQIYRQQQQADGRPSGERRDSRADQKMMSELSFHLDQRTKRHLLKYGPAASPPDAPHEPSPGSPGTTGLPELHLELPGAAPAPIPTYARTRTRGHNDERNREYADSRIAGDSGRARRSESALREFDAAADRFESAASGFTEIIVRFSIEILAIIKRRMDSVHAARRRAESTSPGS